MITDEAVNELIAQRLNEYYSGQSEENVRTDLQEKYANEVWNDTEFDALFSVHVFETPVVHVIRRKDGARGTVAYIEQPRVYFSFVPELTETIA